VLKQYEGYTANIEQHETAWFKGIETISEFALIDSE
jgi:hypothetical protein